MRNAVHIFLSLLMWVLFGYYWYLVGSRQVNAASFTAVGLLTGIAAAEVGLTLWWIAHNQKLAQRNRRQTAPTVAPESFAQDCLDRPLISPVLALLKQTQIIEITLSGNDQKVYAIVESTAI